MNPVPSFNWVFEYQPIASEISTQPSRYNRAESNLLADEKDPHHLEKVVVWVIYLFLQIYYLIHNEAYIADFENQIIPLNK